MSRSKKNASVRPEQRARQTAARREKQRRADRRAVIAAVAAGCAAVVLLLLALAPQGFYAQWTTAATVGPYKVSTGVYNCFYGKAEQELTAMFSMGSDAPPSGDAWRQAVMEQANIAIQNDYAARAAADAAGWTPSQADLDAVSAEIATVEQMAQADGYPDTDSYLAATLGRGCDLDSYRTYTETVRFAQSYRDTYHAGLTFDDAQLQAAYEADPSAFDIVSFRSCYLDGVSQEEAQALADSITDEASFSAAALPYLDSQDEAEADPTLEHMLVSHLNADNRAWLTAADRAYGDVGVVPYRDSGFFLLYYIGMNQDQNARDQAVTDQLREQAFSQWSQDVVNSYPMHTHWLGLTGAAR